MKNASSSPDVLTSTDLRNPSSSTLIPSPCIQADLVPQMMAQASRSPAPSMRSASYSWLLGRYWIASARCAGMMRSAPARSAIVRASLRIR